MEETGTDILLRMFISNLAYQALTNNFFNFNGQLYEWYDSVSIFFVYVYVTWICIIILHR